MRRPENLLIMSDYNKENRKFFNRFDNNSYRQGLLELKNLQVGFKNRVQQSLLEARTLLRRGEAKPTILVLSQDVVDLLFQATLDAKEIHQKMQKAIQYLIQKGLGKGIAHPFDLSINDEGTKSGATMAQIEDVVNRLEELFALAQAKLAKDITPKKRSRLNMLRVLPALLGMALPAANKIDHSDVLEQMHSDRASAITLELDEQQAPKKNEEQDNMDSQAAEQQMMDEIVNFFDQSLSSLQQLQALANSTITDADGNVLFENLALQQNNKIGDTNLDSQIESPDSTLLENPQKPELAQFSLFTLPQFNIEQENLDQATSLMNSAQIQELENFGFTTLDVNFGIDDYGEITGLDPNVQFFNSPEITSEVNRVFDILERARAGQGEFQLVFSFDDQTENTGEILATVSIRLIKPAVLIGASADSPGIVFNPGAMIGFDLEGMPHYVNTTTITYIDRQTNAVKEIEVVNTQVMSAERLSDYIRNNYPNLAIPLDPDKTVIVGLNDQNQPVIIITDTEAFPLIPRELSKVMLPNDINVRSMPDGDVDTEFTNQVRGKLVYLATYEKVMALAGDVPGLTQDNNRNTATVIANGHTWVPTVKVDQSGAESIVWFAEDLPSVSVEFAPTPVASPPSGGVELLVSLVNPGGAETGNLSAEELRARAIEDYRNNPLSSVNADWTAMDVETIKQAPLSPELAEAKATGNYSQFTYLSEGETGEIEPTMIMANLEGGPLRKAILNGRAKKMGLEEAHYYFVNTPETPSIYQNIIIPSIKQMWASSPFNTEGKPTPQILVNQYDYDKRNSMGTEPENKWPGAISFDILTQGSTFIKGQYHPDTNVLIVDIAIEESNSSAAGGDMLRIIERGIAGAFAGGPVNFINWSEEIANPVTFINGADYNEGDIGLNIITSNLEVKGAQKAFPDAKFAYPVNDDPVDNQQ